MAPAWQSPNSSRALIAILVAVSAINPLAINVFVPAMPDIRHSLDASITSVQLVLSAYLYATAVAQLVMGPLSDRIGRRPVLLGGLALYVAASVLCTVAPTIDLLIGGRILQGIGGCAGIVLSRAIVRDRYKRDEAASMLGYVTMGFAVAPMVGPAIGGLLNDFFGWRSIFAVLTGIGVVVLAATIFSLPETRRVDAENPRPGLVRSFGTLARIPAFWAFALTLAFSTSVFFSFLGGTPFVAHDLLGMSGTEFGLYFVFVPGGFILGNFLTARYAPRLGIFTMIIAGATIALAACLGMGVVFALGWYHPLSLFGPMYCIGFANGLTLSNAIAGSVSVRSHLAGAASGLAGFLQVGSGATATVLIGLVLGETQSVFPLVAMMAFFAACALGTAIWSRTARS